MLQSSSAQVRDEEVADGMMTAHKQLNLSDGSTLNEANTNGNNGNNLRSRTIINVFPVYNYPSNVITFC